MDPSSMIGRESPRRAVAAASADARRGRARTLVVRGEPGSGKTTLLDVAAVDHAESMRTIRIAGHRAEREIPYAGIHQLLHAARLTRPDISGDDPLRDASALLSALSALAASRPVLLLVDDAQWLDPASRRMLVFVARRLDADAVCMVFTVHPAYHEELAVGTTISLEPLSRNESLEVLRRAFPDVTVRVAAKVAEHAGGLPLALCEIPAELSVEQRRGDEPLPTELPLGESLTQLYSKRMDALTDRGRLALLAASFDALDAPQYRRVLAALRCGLDDLDDAERSGLVRVVDGRCVFRHPTVPAAVRNSARIRERTEVHRALASEFIDDPIRAAAHLRHDPDADGNLLLRTAEAGARAATARRSHADAAELWEWAAELAGQTERSRAFLREAARSHVSAGSGPEARSLIERLLPTAREKTEKAGLLRDLTLVSLWTRSVAPPDSARIEEQGVRLLRSDEDGARTAATALLIALATALLGAGEFRQARRTSLAVLRHATGELTSEQRLLCDVTAVMVGEDGAGAELRGMWIADYPWRRILDPATPAGFITAVLGWLHEFSNLDEIVVRCRRAIDDHGPSASGLYVTGYTAAVQERCRGNWERALLEFDALGRLVIDTDFPAPYPFIALRHAHLFAARGDRAGCERMRRIARERAPAWTPLLAHLDHCVAGLLALAHRDFDTAADELRRGREIERETGLVISGYLSRMADEFEAAWRLGDAQRLGTELDRFETAMRGVRHRGMLGLAARCRALVAGPDEMDARFAEAVALLGGEPDGFEAARAHLLWGERLRRVRRKADALERLTAAHAAFSRLGAGAWVAQCDSELAACGVRRASMAPIAGGIASRLTPREFEVAREVASGATNADAARRLFISERTVEFHLSSVFRKLEIRRRHELAVVLAPAQEPGSGNAH